MKVWFAPRALADIEAIFRHLDALSSIGARNVLRDIYAAVRSVAEHPEAAPRTDLADLRVKIVIRYRYKVFYRVRADAIEIVHVRHTSRRPWSG